jgi:hypothetical protein
MKKYLYILAAIVILTGCKKETDLSFTTTTYQKKTSLPCKENCAAVSIAIPIADSPPVIADSINKKVFNTIRQIIFFGEKPYTATNYEDLMTSFIKSYEELKNDFPEDVIGWEGKVKGSINYVSGKIINIKLNHYTYTGGAHGYEGNTSLIFDHKTGKSLSYKSIFSNEEGFRQYAENKFREKFKIPADKNINSTGLMFENEKFTLPQNIFFKDDGLLLYYNSYEIASYAEGQKELFLSYSEIAPFVELK